MRLYLWVDRCRYRLAQRLARRLGMDVDRLREEGLL